MRHSSALFVGLMLVAATTARAQESQLSVRPHVGAFAPGMSLVAVADGYHPNVQLGGGPLAGFDLRYRARRGLTVYGGVTSVFTRLYHSSVMELREVDSPHSSRVTLVTPTGGVLFTPRFRDGPAQPVLRVGAGSKIYYFDLYDVNQPVADLTGDFGIGLTAGSGSLRLAADARWMPSRFDASYLPIRVVGNEKQQQSDWSFELGFRLTP
jgi:hypothetical protein